MPTTADTEATGAVEELGGETPPSTLEWTFRPLARPGQLAALLLVLGIVGGIASVVGLTTGSWGWLLFAALAMLVTATPAIFPTRYVLDADGVEVRHGLRRRRHRWTRFGAAISDGKYGIYLRPAPPGLRGRLSEGLTLLAAEDHEAIREFIERHVGGDPA